MEKVVRIHIDRRAEEESKYFMPDLDCDTFTAQANELRTFAYAALHLHRDGNDDSTYSVGHWSEEMKDWAGNSLLPFLDALANRLPELATVFLDTSWDCFYLREEAEKAADDKGVDG
jgi:hypothetical protein